MLSTGEEISQRIIRGNASKQQNGDDLEWSETDGHRGVFERELGRLPLEDVRLPGLCEVGGEAADPRLRLSPEGLVETDDQGAGNLLGCLQRGKSEAESATKTES